MSSELPIQ